MKPIGEYRKPNRKLTESKTTTVNLEKRHFDFVSKNSLNLSKIVRDTIDDMMTRKKGGRDEK